MEFRKEYEMKLGVITAIEDGRIKTPHHVPIDVYIQEADTLYVRARKDKEALTGVGLSWELVEDLPIRTRALVEAEAQWNVWKDSGRGAEKEWEKQSAVAYELRNRLLEVFRFAFRKRPDLLAVVRDAVKGQSHAAMIQGIYDLSSLGRKNSKLLEAVGFDMSLLDEAAETSEKLASLLAEAVTSREGYSSAKKIRDQAYTHLKEAVDEIREYGRYVFRSDRNRFIGYRSNHIHRKRKRKPTKPKTTEPDKK
jgi:hypothetical protein